MMTSQERLRKLFWVGVGVSALFHFVVLGTMAHVVRLSRLLQETKPVSAKFVIQRDPRVAKPFEMRKRPQSRERKMVRQEVEVQARTSQLVSSRVGGISLRSLSPAPMDLEAGSKLVSIDMGARAMDLGVTTTKDPENRIDMREQLLDLNYLDTGKYQAMVVQDPANKQKIQGYFHIAQAYSARMVEQNILSNLSGGDSGTELLQNPHAVQNLVDALNEYSSIRADFSARLPLSSRELLETPWVFVPPTVFTLTEGELENLGRYLRTGGFLLLDASGSVGGDVDAFFRQMVKSALAKVGKEARFFRLPQDHPIYHSFFDFDGPPGSGSGSTGVRADYLIGVEVDSRLAVVLSYQSLAYYWENVGFRNDRKYYTDNARYLQFGINTIVFALTQEGSITNRVMQTVK
jgi:hypothetical protein